MQLKQQENFHFQILHIVTLAINRIMTKIKFRNNINAGLIVACVGLIATGQANAAYTFTDLGTLGGSNSSANAINASGQVVGYSRTLGSYYDHATIWNGTIATDLSKQVHSFEDGNSYATAINAAGQVAGYAFTDQSFTNRATVWSGGGASYLPYLNSEALKYSSLYSGYNYAYGINGAGQVAGSSSALSPAVRATVWNGTTTDLGTELGYFSISIATAINDSGQVVGYSRTVNSTNQAILWNGTTATFLDSLGGDSYAYAINASGQIAGVSGEQATVWNGTSATGLGALGGGYSRANAINALGQVVGASNSHATLWNGTTPTDLNSLLDDITLSEGWILTSATGINDNGWIVGNASNSLLGISSHAFLLSVAAVPEPESYAMLMAGIALIGFTTRRRKSNSK